jgi:hypothetical protein
MTTPWTPMTGLVFTDQVMTGEAAREVALAYLAQRLDLQYVSVSYRSADGRPCAVGVLR